MRGKKAHAHLNLYLRYLVNILLARLINVYQFKRKPWTHPGVPHLIFLFMHLVKIHLLLNFYLSKVLSKHELGAMFSQQIVASFQWFVVNANISIWKIFRESVSVGLNSLRVCNNSKSVDTMPKFLPLVLSSVQT